MTLKRNVRYVFKDEASKLKFKGHNDPVNSKIVKFVEENDGIVIAEDADEDTDSGFYFNDFSDFLNDNNFISTEEAELFKEWVDIEDLGLITVTKSPVVEVKVLVTKENYQDVIEAITKAFQ